MKEYIVSARKYRPVTFDTVVGQSTLITTLKNAVQTGKLAHAYLFCGPRGVGKTTCARIFAKAINCLTPTDSGEACNECESCKSFNEGRSYNIFELDAASNNSVENIKSLMEQTRIPPQVGKYKVFIIDEVHMLSSAAFNAFLKTLEEPPAHVVFILATTEKHKILPTIISRCQIYDFDRMGTMDIISHLKSVAQREGITYEEEALSIIAEKADGGMRDALSVFDQVVSFCQGNITYTKVLEDLNVLDLEHYFQVIDLALQNKVTDVMVLLNSVLSKGFDAGHFTQGLASHVRNVLMAKDVQTLSLIEASKKHRQRYETQAKQCSTQFLYKALQLLNSCDINYKQSTNKRLLVELTLIQVAQITQPEEASDGVGHSPKRLKPLFIRLAVQPKTQSNNNSVRLETNKVSSGNASSEKPVAMQEQLQKASSATTTTMNRPKLKKSDIGFSFKSFGNNYQTQTTVAVEQKDSTTEQRNFTADDLRIAWQRMCQSLPQEWVGLASRMRNITPVITIFPAVEAVIDNELLLKQMQDIKDSLRANLCHYLQNNAVELSFRLAEAQEVTKIYSKREVYSIIKETNPAFSKLCDALKLELA